MISELAEDLAHMLAVPLVVMVLAAAAIFGVCLVSQRSLAPTSRPVPAARAPKLPDPPPPSAPEPPKPKRPH